MFLWGRESIKVGPGPSGPKDNTYLLDTSKLRKDQVYFVNKRKDASSDLYSLFDFKDFRENMDLEKAYLQGRFDAIPYIDDSMSNLKQLG